MKLTIAENAGFCFGVRKATDALEEAIKNSGGKIYTLGRIIHNDTYIEKIKSQGAVICSADDIDGIVRRARDGEKITFIIRAHGERFEIIEKLEKIHKEFENFTLLDCTCPYVQKVRRIARENSGEGKLFILIGTKDHPEVEGIMSCLLGDGLVFQDSAGLEEWISDKKEDLQKYRSVAIAAQTTQKLSEWKKCLKIIKKVYTNALIFDTICNVTEKRQEEAERLAAESEVMIVIGSSDSSNSKKLYEVCREFCSQVYFVGSAFDCKSIEIPANSKVSITAGASTPSSVIQEVCKTMNEQMTENFAEMLESSMKTLNTGDVVEGVVTSVSNNEIHLDLGTKTTGVITHEKATHDPQAKLDELFRVGDVVKAKVIKVSDVEGIAMLDKNRVDSEVNWEKIIAAYESGEVVEGKVTEAVKGGVIINIYSVRVFIPASLTGVPKDNDLDILVGTTQKVKIIEIKNERHRAYASIRAVIREERRAKEDAFWASVEEGQEYDGEVKSLTSYGAFVDLGGVDGMVHNSELSWLRIKHPSEVVSVGDVIHVTVKAIDREKKRISLSYKTDGMNPWNIFTEKYSVGDVAEVKIVSLMPFGAFAQIVPGVDGLIHISQITDHKIARPDEILENGQTVEAKIVAVDEENHKVSLSIRELMEENAEGREDYEEYLASSDDAEKDAEISDEDAEVSDETSAEMPVEETSEEE